MNVIRFELSESEIWVVANCIKHNTEAVKGLCPERSSGQMYVVPAIKTPEGVSARIELMLRKSVIDRKIRIYSHLTITENNYTIARLLYVDDLEGDMLKDMEATDNIPYRIVFERSIA